MGATSWGDSILTLLVEHPLRGKLALIEVIAILTSDREDIVEVVQDHVSLQHVKPGSFHI